MLNINDTLFLITDVQEKLLNAVFNKEQTEKNSYILAKTSNILDIPLIITEQYPKGLGQTIKLIKENSNGLYFEKNSFSAIEEKEIYTKITNLKKKNIIICGIETHICVYQTALDLLENGYNVTLISDASSSRKEENHICACSNLLQKGVSVETTEMILFELIKSSKHPHFKEIQNLIK